MSGYEADLLLLLLEDSVELQLWSMGILDRGGWIGTTLQIRVHMRASGPPSTPGPRGQTVPGGRAALLNLLGAAMRSISAPPLLCDG